MTKWKTATQAAMLRSFQKRVSQQSQSYITPPAADTVSTTSYLVETTPGVTPVHIYYPMADVSKKHPVYINLHGGGFVMGSAYEDEGWCKHIAAETPCVVVNVDYHLAPKTRFPATVLEVFEIIEWLMAHAGRLSLQMNNYVLGGHSAGGNLAATASLMLRDTGHKLPKLQVLDYPVLDLQTDPYEKPAYSTAIPPYIAQIFNDSYLQTPQDARHPYASPLYAEELEGLPPALVITAEYDSLAREATQYVSRLEKAGVAVQHYPFSATSHGFTHMGNEETALEAWTTIIHALKRAFK
ncbi:alpha/beta hydrolase [Marinococcus halophilus]|uniref:alpha/beta hydrolase n=1 Tax=Marinococcus halophilus TaxID=1371 RepID=UPI0009A8BC8C|nr:alpha/beta hydrolase [Marinococcus halophilus]